MHISDNYVAVEKVEEPKAEGFTQVNLIDSSVFKGRVVHCAEGVFLGDRKVMVGDTVLFAKFSPDTHEVEHDGKKLKFVSKRDVLAVI